MKKQQTNRRYFVKTIAVASAATAISPLISGEGVPVTESTHPDKPAATGLSKQIFEQKPYLALGKPNPDISFTQGPCAVYGRYTADSKITFEGKCQYPWEFMATGTGVSGLTIAAGREVTTQINHSAAFDELGFLRSLGRLRLDWYGGGGFWSDERTRFSGLDKVVRMVHDLRQSVIMITSEGGKGGLRLEVRAHKELDVIRIDIVEEPYVGGQLHLQLQKDYMIEDRVENDTYLSWHVNPSGTTSNRCFGTAMAFDVPEGCTQKWWSGRGEVETRGKYERTKKYTLWIVAGSNRNGFAAWSEDVLARLAKARAMGDGFIASHEAWWHEFWERSRLELPGDDGSHLRHKAAFDIYRYYMTCSTDRRRETPLRWFNDVLSFNEEPMWLAETMSIQDYQGWYGTMRMGDLDNLGSYLEKNVFLLPAMRRWVKESYGYDGAVHPYAQNIMQPFLGNGDITVKNPDKMNFNGNLYILMLFCDYVSLGGDKKLIEEGLFPWAKGVLSFFHNRYPNKSANGHIDFTPSTDGETYYDATDAAELLVGMKLLLPRLLTLGETQGWDKATLTLWRQMYHDLPDLPRGSIKIHERRESDWKADSVPSYYWPREANRVISLEKSDLLAPVRKLSSEQSRTHDRENPELHSIWPGKLMLRNKKDREVAIGCGLCGLSWT
jgi:hypothetical protein